MVEAVKILASHNIKKIKHSKFSSPPRPETRYSFESYVNTQKYNIHLDRRIVHNELVSSIEQNQAELGHKVPAVEALPALEMIITLYNVEKKFKKEAEGTHARPLIPVKESPRVSSYRHHRRRDLDSGSSYTPAEPSSAVPPRFDSPGTTHGGEGFSTPSY